MWAIWASLGVGIWMMAAPLLLAYGPPASASDWVVGPLIAVVSAIALRPTLRSVFVLNVVFSGWLLLGPWLLNFDVLGALNSAICAIALYLLSKVPQAEGRTANNLP